MVVNFDFKLFVFNFLCSIFAIVLLAFTVVSFSASFTVEVKK